MDPPIRGKGRGRGYLEESSFLHFARKICCVPQTLLGWVQRHEVNTGAQPGVSTSDAQHMKEKSSNKRTKSGRRATLVRACSFRSTAGVCAPNCSAVKDEWL
jgi:hypothetical protein